MADNAVPTLVPERPAQDPHGAKPAPSPSAEAGSDAKALFDSIAQDDLDSAADEAPSSLRTLFAGLLWFGYAVAIIVALVLIWSAANGLLTSLPG